MAGFWKRLFQGQPGLGFGDVARARRDALST